MKDNYEKKIIDFNEIEVPEIIYKYRSSENENHLRFIKNKEVFMAAPSMFEDPKDCKITTRYDLMTNEEAFRFGMKLSKIANPHFTEFQHINDSGKWVNQGIYKKPEFYSGYIQFVNEEYDKRRGILSLTAKPCLDEMWEKYADNSCGICIGYNTKILFKHLGGGGDVAYVDDLPLIMPAPIMDDIEAFHKTVYFKEKKWEFEQEYRASKFFQNPASIKDRQIPIPKEAFNRIILGKNIKNAEHIKEIVKTYIGDIPIYEQKNFC
ncbi:hypothetical protein DRF62_04665 [Chryseobacterium piscium]|uniref:DUF2971 domain-containing protein n=1 Tax=Chryseobacterium piscium TaxID=333702 RepID=A0A3D9BRH5_9FLAO|nr:DUF2971 domain-containing protein [Chryseobacterium piscium]REC56133.1 hypothetical protein DRF62_04665 [Chryseobacterium piscium]